MSTPARDAEINALELESFVIDRHAKALDLPEIEKPLDLNIQIALPAGNSPEVKLGTGLTPVPLDICVKCETLRRILDQLDITQTYLGWRTGRQWIDRTGRLRFSMIDGNTISKFVCGRLATWSEARFRIAEALNLPEEIVFPEVYRVLSNKPDAK